MTIGSYGSRINETLGFEKELKSDNNDETANEGGLTVHSIENSSGNVINFDLLLNIITIVNHFRISKLIKQCLEKYRLLFHIIWSRRRTPLDTNVKISLEFQQETVLTIELIGMALKVVKYNKSGNSNNGTKSKQNLIEKPSFINYLNHVASTQTIQCSSVDQVDNIIRNLSVI